MGDAECAWKPAAALEVGDHVVGRGTVEWMTTSVTVRLATATAEVYGASVLYHFDPEESLLVQDRPTIRVSQGGYYTGLHLWRVEVDAGVAATFRSKRHAECYAEKLRNDPALRAEALGS